jgi:hypothetical protein
MAQTNYDKYIDDIIKDIQNTVEIRIIHYFLRANLILPTNYKDYLHTHTHTKVEYWNQFRHNEYGVAIEKTISVLVNQIIDKIVLSDDMQDNKDTIEC